MRKLTLCLVAVMAIMCLFVQEVKAQTSESGIDWHEYSIAVNDITIQDIYPGHDNSFPASYDYYLYVVGNDGFINAGGEYGSQAVLEAQGLGLHLQRLNAAEDFILVRSAMQRSEGVLHANFLGLNGAGTGAVNLDRPNNPTKHISFLFESVSGSHNEYRMKINNEENEDEYLTVNTENGAITTTSEETEASKFLLLNTSSVMQAIQDQTGQKQIDVSGLVKNARFLRNIREGIWNWVDGEGNTGTDHYLGMSTELGNSGEWDHWNYCMDNGAFGAMEIGEGTYGRYVQTITGLKKGLYAVKAQGFFYGDGESTARLFAGQRGQVLQKLETTDLTAFENGMEDDYNTIVGNTSEYEAYYRDNVPAARVLENNDMYDPDITRYETTIYVTVTDNGVLGIGLDKQDAAGSAFIDNVRLYYLGDYEFGIDAYNTNTDNIDTNPYTTARRFNLRRHFNLEKWNSLILPVDVPSGQIQGAFGGRVKLSKLAGIDPNNTDHILFEPVDLTGNEGIKAGECYLIKVTKEPDVAIGSNYTFNRIAEGESGEANMETVTYDGPVYHIEGVSRATEYAATETSGSHGEGDLQLDFKGYFYDTLEETANHAPKNSYIMMDDGKMHHILETDAPVALPGTQWYLTVPAGSGSKHFIINGEDQTTDILDIVTEKKGTVDGVYNLNGQKVAEGTSLEGLAKGIYVVKGKKVVVK